MLLLFSFLFLFVSGIHSQAVSSVPYDCNALETLVDDDVAFEHCLTSGVWQSGLVGDERYDLEENEQCGWCVSVMPNVLAFMKRNNEVVINEFVETQDTSPIMKSVESGIDADVVKEQFLDEICNSLSGTNTKAQCIELTEKYYKRTIAMLAAGVPAERVCSLLKVCHIKFGICYTSPDVVCADLETAKKCGKFDSCLQFEWSKKVATVPAPVEGSAECEECEALIDYVKQYLSDSSNREAIVDGAENICERFFTNAQCEKYVGESIGEIILLLENDVSAAELCSLLGMCKSNEQTEQTPENPRGLLGADECVAPLDTICSDLMYARRCKMMTRCFEWGSSKFGLMNADSTYNFKHASSGYMCEVCEGVVESVKQMLDDEKTEDEIEKEVLTLCDKCPEKDKCVALVKEYLTMVIKMVDAQLDPDTICQLMKLCHPYEKRVVGVRPVPYINGMIEKPRVKVEDVKCSTDYYCPSGNTCCAMTDDSYGCCPLADAVCCSDHVHCCPGGYTCQEDECVKSDGSDLNSFMAYIRMPKKRTMERTRRHVIDREHTHAKKVESSHDEEFTLPTVDDLSQWGNQIAEHFNKKLEEADGCYVCKIITKIYQAAPIDDDKMESELMPFYEQFCTLYKQYNIFSDVECPSLDTVREILKAAKEYKGDGCPLTYMCTEKKSFGLPDLLDMFKGMLCDSYQAVIDMVDDKENWDAVSTVVQQYTQNSDPHVQDAVNVGMMEARRLEQDGTFTSKKEAMLESLNELPRMKYCNLQIKN